MENFMEKWDPYKHLVQSKDENSSNGWLYAPHMLPNGTPELTKDGLVVLVPQMYIDADGFRDWFHTEFPNGRTAVIRHTQDAVIGPQGFLLSPSEVFEVQFFLDKEDKIPTTSGWGMAKNESQNTKIQPISAAISFAFKNGMRNLGFGVDLEYEKIVESLPKYVEIRTAGGVLVIVNIQDYEAAAPVNSAKVDIETMPVSEPMKDVEEKKKRTKKVSKEVSEDKVESTVLDKPIKDVGTTEKVPDGSSVKEVTSEDEVFAEEEKDPVEKAADDIAKVTGADAAKIKADADKAHEDLKDIAKAEVLFSLKDGVSGAFADKCIKCGLVGKPVEKIANTPNGLSILKAMSVKPQNLIANVRPETVTAIKEAIG